MIPLVVENHPYRPFANSGANLFVVLLIQAPPSRELEPPANPARFNWHRTGSGGADISELVHWPRLLLPLQLEPLTTGC